MNMLTNNLQRNLFGLLLIVQLTACGGGGGGTDSNTGNPVDPPAKTANAVADAGMDQDISRNFTVTLDGSASSDPDGDTLSYTWTQVYGPDVTEGNGYLTGEMAQFNAPEDVSTLIFELRVNDGAGDSAPDEVQVNILEDANVALFVDGDNGSDDSGDGSRDNPYQSLAKALGSVSANQEDIYVMSRTNDTAYDETAAVLQVPTGTSLYGGFDMQWVRDTATNRTRVDAYSTAIAFSGVNFDTWLSGFDIETVNSGDAGSSVYGVVAMSGFANLVISDNTITTGDVGFGDSRTPGSNYGVYLSQLNNVRLQRSVITTGAAGHGAVGLQGNIGENGSNGADGSGSGQASGGTGNAGYDGGDGGARGTCLVYTNGLPGSPGGGGALAGGGGAGGSGSSADPGSPGGNGLVGAAGVAGAGGTGIGAMDGGYIPVTGVRGGRGNPGGGGGGGGGGEASFWSECGGGGGGGGEGGGGGQGGEGGQGGAASIGVWLDSIQGEIIISDSDIASGFGGDGNSGGLGGNGGSGGGYGRGATANGGNGGRGGNGGNGGTGGYGGAGAGGPSIGVLIGSNLAPTLSDNVIVSGSGGIGGDGGADSNGGDGGWSYAVFDMNLEDGMVPVLLRNDLTAGEGGAPGDGINTPAVGQSGRRNF
ncbi:PKD domain-containing protein [Kaarinaea lacus]